MARFTSRDHHPFQILEYIHQYFSRFDLSRFGVTVDPVFRMLAPSEGRRVLSLYSLGIVSWTTCGV